MCVWGGGGRPRSRSHTMPPEISQIQFLEKQNREAKNETVCNTVQILERLNRRTICNINDPTVVDPWLSAIHIRM